MISSAQLKAQSRYDKAHTQQILFKLNRTTDADILAKLEDVENKQGYVKQLIRQDIRGNSPVLPLDAIRYLVRPLASKYSLKSLYVFGSYARGDATPESDIDLMVDGGDVDTAEKYFSMKSELAEVLGRDVDLVMASAAKKNTTRAGRRFLDHYERDRILIYEQV